MESVGLLGGKSDKGSILEAASTYIQRSVDAAAAGIPPHSAVAAEASGLGSVPIDYLRVFQSIGVAQAIAGIDGSFLDCNRRFCELTGYSRDEIRQRSIFNMTPQGELSRTFAVISSMMKSAGDSGEPDRCHLRTTSDSCHSLALSEPFTASDIVAQW